MKHCIFKGDEVETSVEVDAEIVTTFDEYPITLKTGTVLTFESIEGEWFEFLLNDHDVIGDRFVDVPIRLKVDEFTHDHGVCEDVFDEHQKGATEWLT